MLAGNKQGQPLQDLSFVTNSCKCSDPRSSAKSTNQSIKNQRKRWTAQYRRPDSTCSHQVVQEIEGGLWDTPSYVTIKGQS